MSQSPGPPARPTTPTPTPTPNSDAVKAACEAALADFLTKVEAVFKADIKKELSESTNENLNEYIGALQVQLSNQTPPQAAMSQNPSLSRAMSEVVKLHLAFQLRCATRAAERENEEAKMRVEDIYSSGSMRNLYRRYRYIRNDYWISIGMFIGLGGSLATPLLPIWVPENSWGFWAWHAFFFTVLWKLVIMGLMLAFDAGMAHWWGRGHSP